MTTTTSTQPITSTIPTIVKAQQKVCAEKKPAAEKKSDAEKKKPVVEKPVVAVVEKESVPATEQESVPVVVENVVDTSASVKRSVDFVAKLQQVSTLIASLRTEFRVIEKEYSRELKIEQKKSSKGRRKSGNRAPSGFVMATLISDELASFLGKSSGTEMARTQVTREITAYVRTNNLQDPTNGRKIVADDKLSKLLKLTPTDELTYFNLQRYMSCHFQKGVSSAAVVAPAVAVSVL